VRDAGVLWRSVEDMSVLRSSEERGIDGKAMSREGGFIRNGIVVCLLLMMMMMMMRLNCCFEIFFWRSPMHCESTDLEV
jgi:hypothetical protein